MPSYSKSSPIQLRKRLEQVTQDLEAAAPGPYAEMLLLQKLIRASEGETADLFREAGGKKEAVILCLQLAGEWLSIDEILKRMIEGGYRWKSLITARGLLNDGIQYYVSQGDLLCKDDNLYGLPEWVEGSTEKASK